MGLLDQLKEKYKEIGEEIKKMEQQAEFDVIKVPYNCGFFEGIGQRVGDHLIFKLYRTSALLFSSIEAAEYVKERKGRLLTKKEISLLIAYDQLADGQPSFWSDTVATPYNEYTWIFNGSNCYLAYVASASKHNVRYVDIVE